RLLGFGVNDQFELQTTSLTSLRIPLGTAATAQATENVELQGVLAPSGDVADTAAVIESATLGDADVPRPNASGITVGVAPTIDSSTISFASNGGVGTLT